jgi:hypothetical protein
MGTVLVILVVVGLWILFMWALVDAARRPAAAFGRARVSKGATIVLLLLTGGLGGAYYLLRVRPIVSKSA